MKKRVPKSKASNKKSSLSGAINDLEKEIARLSSEKKDLRSTLDRTTGAIGIDHKLEEELQRKIARLIDKEARLNQKKKNLQVKLDTISDKITKISKIRSEIGDI